MLVSCAKFPCCTDFCLLFEHSRSASYERSRTFVTDNCLGPMNKVSFETRKCYYGLHLKEREKAMLETRLEQCYIPGESGVLREKHCFLQKKHCSDGMDRPRYFSLLFSGLPKTREDGKN